MSKLYVMYSLFGLIVLLLIISVTFALNPKEVHTTITSTQIVTWPSTLTVTQTTTSTVTVNQSIPSTVPPICSDE